MQSMMGEGARALQLFLARRLREVEAAVPVRRFGVVSAVTGSTVSVDFAAATPGAAATTVAGVRRLASYTPTVGDEVVVHLVGGVPLVLGRLA